MSVLHSSLMILKQQASPKAYWKILKIFVNRIKISLIPPLVVRNQLVTDFLVKANLFNNYFMQKCTASASSIFPNITFAFKQKQYAVYSAQMNLSRFLNRWIQTRPTDTMKYLFE